MLRRARRADRAPA